MKGLRRTRCGLLAALLLSGCSSGNGEPPAAASGREATPAAGPPAPWVRHPPLSAAAVPPVFLEQWSMAENRRGCAPIAPQSLGEAREARPRGATFSGGWGVAYDLPDTRSALGVAGTGVEAASPSYSEWPHQRRWADGSTAGYGPEGGTGPNQLAYLRIAGQQCLYNVWSRLGVDHLEFLLDQLRFVERDPAPGR